MSRNVFSSQLNALYYFSSSRNVFCIRLTNSMHSISLALFHMQKSIFCAHANGANARKTNRFSEKMGWKIFNFIFHSEWVPTDVILICQCYSPFASVVSWTLNSDANRWMCGHATNSNNIIDTHTRARHMLRCVVKFSNSSIIFIIISFFFSLTFDIETHIAHRMEPNAGFRNMRVSVSVADTTNECNLWRDNFKSGRQHFLARTIASQPYCEQCAHLTKP